MSRCALLMGLLVVSWISACGPGLYELAPPPAREDWQRHSLNPAENDLRSQERFLAAKDAVLAFVEAMNDERWSDAYGLLSNETRILLDDLSPTGLGEAVLSDGVVRRGDAEYQFEPIDLFVIRDLADIVDTWEDEMEAETYRRQEVWAVSSDGEAHHLVLILEENSWHLHKTEIEVTPGAPGRRSE